MEDQIVQVIDGQVLTAKFVVVLIAVEVRVDLGVAGPGGFAVVLGSNGESMPSSRSASLLSKAGGVPNSWHSAG